MSGELRAYMVYEGDSHDGAILLAYAHTAQQARRLGHPFVSQWTGGRFIDVRAKWLRSGVPQFRQKGEPHVIEEVPYCENCELWHEEPLIDGLCEGCRDERDWESDPTDSAVPPVKP